MLRKVVLSLLLLVVALPCFAENAPSTPVAAPILVVDVKRILDESKAAISAQRKIESQRGAFQTEIAGQEKHVRDAEQDLLQQREKLDAAQYAEKENQLRQKFRDVEKYVQERRRALDRATKISMDKVHGVLLDIVTEIAKKRGSQAVLVKQQVLWVPAAQDITDEVLQRLNTQLPDLPVDVVTPATKP